MKSLQLTINALNTLNLNCVSSKLDDILKLAESEKYSYIKLLNTVFSTEINERNNKRLRRNMIGAHFPIEKNIDSFDFSRVSGITINDVNNLLECSWIDKKENLLFFGPPGLGKTHFAIAFGITAITKGYKVCFERATNLMRLLKTSEIQRTSDFRIKKLMKSDLIIIDEIGYTPIDKRESNLFFNLISELYEKSSIIITSNKSFESWAEMMGDQIMTTAMLDRLMHRANIYNLKGDSYRLITNQKKEEEITINN